jgi:hypothetical protein
MDGEICHAGSYQKKVEIEVLILATCFKAKKVTKDKEECYIMMKESVFQEDTESLKCMCLTVQDQAM